MGFAEADAWPIVWLKTDKLDYIVEVARKRNPAPHTRSSDVLGIGTYRFNVFCTVGRDGGAQPRGLSRASRSGAAGPAGPR